MVEKEIVASLFPEEVTIVGDASIEYIVGQIRSNNSIESDAPPDGRDNFAATEVVQIVVSALTVVKIVFEVLKLKGEVEKIRSDVQANQTALVERVRKASEPRILQLTDEQVVKLVERTLPDA